jgi:hypothetical protein
LVFIPVFSEGGGGIKKRIDQWLVSSLLEGVGALNFLMAKNVWKLFSKNMTKLADNIGSVFGPGKRYETSGHQEVELALVRLSWTLARHSLLICSAFVRPPSSMSSTSFSRLVLR